MTNRSVEIEDDEGIIYGKLSYDSIKIDNIIINNYQFVLANEHDINFKDYPNGKLGLGIDKENKISFLSQLKQNNLIDNEIFIIDKISKKLILGKKPQYLEDVPNESFPLYDVSKLDEKYRQSWACELEKIFFGIYISDEMALSFDSNGNLVPQTFKSIDFERSKEIYGPAILDSGYPYLEIPKKYLNYFKGNLIIKFLEGRCYEKKDEDYSIYFICDRICVEKYVNYLTFFIDKKMFFLYGEDLFRLISNDKVELLVRFTKKNDIIFKLGAPFLKKWTTLYDYGKMEITFYGHYIKDLYWKNFWYYLWHYFWRCLLLVAIVAVIIFIIFIIYCLCDRCCK